MTKPELMEPAFEALDACHGALGVLDAKCCAPGRSPSMAELAATLTEARVKLRAATIAPDTGGPAALAVLEDAGAQVGRLQVGCCAPDRMPLYAEILENLTKARATLRTVVSS